MILLCASSLTSCFDCRSKAWIVSTWFSILPIATLILAKESRKRIAQMRRVACDSRAQIDHLDPNLASLLGIEGIGRPQLVKAALHSAEMTGSVWAAEAVVACYPVSASPVGFG